MCVFVSVPLKFNSTTATTLSRGTCDCAPDLGRGTPSYSCCFCLRPLRPRFPSSPRSCPYGLIPHRRPWLRIQYPYLRAHDTPRSNPMKKEKRGPGVACSIRQTAAAFSAASIAPSPRHPGQSRPYCMPQPCLSQFGVTSTRCRRNDGE